MVSKLLLCIFSVSFPSIFPLFVYPFNLQCLLREFKSVRATSQLSAFGTRVHVWAETLRALGNWQLHQVISLSTTPSHTGAYQAWLGLQISSHTAANILFVWNVRWLSLCLCCRQRGYYHTAPRHQQFFTQFGFFSPGGLHFISSFSLIPNWCKCSLRGCIFTSSRCI